ncbi:15386_t:CDS:1 [Cetraspora pellucida]|uniref:15386_t:CDS:1 n=1 Tax=Cetraspora pellucida TaxID=1433469 RepID=A0A9N9P377_9GLOM|nr:15386_t:CDS:1 [Cetraspora pellucida]
MSNKRKHSPIACTNCRILHKKCCGNPCSLCEKNSTQCKFIKGKKRGPNKGSRKHPQKMIRNTIQRKPLETDNNTTQQPTLTTNYMQQNPDSFCHSDYNHSQQISQISPNNIHNNMPQTNVQTNSTNFDIYDGNHYLTQKFTDINNPHIQPTLTDDFYHLDHAQQNFHSSSHLNYYHTRQSLVNIHKSSVGNHYTWKNSNQIFCNQILYGDNPYNDRKQDDRKQDNLLVHDASYSFESPTNTEFYTDSIGN